MEGNISLLISKKEIFQNPVQKTMNFDICLDVMSLSCTINAGNVKRDRAQVALAGAVGCS